MKMGYTIALTVGIIIFIISLVLFRQSIDFIQNGNRTTATVIELEKISDSDGTTYKPIFKFKTFTNQEIIYKYHTSSLPATFDVGEEVTIVYKTDNPNNAKILTYFGLFIWTIVLMSISMPLIVIGGGYFLTKQYLI
jgi:hypothetical protein